MRIEGVLVAEHRDLRDAGHLRDLLRQEDVGVIVDVISGSVSECTDSSRIGESAGLTFL